VALLLEHEVQEAAPDVGGQFGPSERPGPGHGSSVEEDRQLFQYLNC
jgi:hypothetical protein